MGKPSRLLSVLCLLGCAACASDGILAPTGVPEPAGIEAAAVLAAEPASPGATGIIRCARTTTPPAGEPLFIVDGRVLPQGTLADIDPASIDTIEVVKGETAAAIFGPRVANGIVIITTRAGGARPGP
jgi:TonB-dependent SusC/RagA subfamily outer membrane receptor